MRGVCVCVCVALSDLSIYYWCYCCYCRLNEARLLIKIICYSSFSLAFVHFVNWHFVYICNNRWMLLMIHNTIDIHLFGEYNWIYSLLNYPFVFNGCKMFIIFISNAAQHQVYTRIAWIVNWFDGGNIACRPRVVRRQFCFFFMV